MAQIRAFLALPIEGELSAYLADSVAAMRYSDPNIELRWLDAENYHLTLHFLGDQPLELLQRAIDHMHDQIHGAPAFDLKVEQICPFPASKPKLIVAQVKASKELLKLHQQLGGILTDCGIRTENKAFKPHITLARSRRRLGGGKIGVWQVQAKTFTINQVVLYESHLLRSGAEYAKLHAIELTDLSKYDY